MRILFYLTNTLWRYNLPEAFKDSGHEVLIIDSLQNESSLSKVINFRPNFMMSIGWSSSQSIKNQLAIKKYTKNLNIPHIYWSVEDPAFTHSFSLPLIQRVQPEFVFSISLATVKYFNKLGIKAEYLDFGYNPKIHNPTNPIDKYTSSISVVANAYPQVLKQNPNHYRHTSIHTLITPLLKNNYRIDFWGNDWDKMCDYFNFDIPLNWIHGYLPYTEANKVYCSSKINIGLQNYTNQLTQRTYEIISSGGFLLTCNTPAVRKIFDDKKHLIYSSSPENTIELVNYYLDNPDKRYEISNNALSAIPDFTYLNKASYIIDTLKKHKII